MNMITYTDNGTEQGAVVVLPDDVLEELFFAELVVNEAFAAKVAPIYRDSWISDDELRPMSTLVVKWRQKFGGGITKDLMQALLSRYVQDHPRCGIEVGWCIRKFVRALNLNMNLGLGLSPQSRVKTLNEFIRRNILRDADMLPEEDADEIELMDRTLMAVPRGVRRDSPGDSP